MGYETFERLCKEKGVTPYRVAKDTGVTTATLSSWKSGRYTPKADKLQKLADYFGVGVEAFFEDAVQTSEHLSAYYEDTRAYELAKKIFENQRLRMLFDAAEDVDPEDLELVINMVKRFKRTNDSDE